MLPSLRRISRTGLLVVSVAVLVGALPACGSVPGDSADTDRPDFSARTVRVTDGDTIVVRVDSGRDFKVRLIEIRD